ncbi:tetratricopeptide repeat protein [Paenibacillus sp. PL2-23]|uniref:tetratricopeptide repeat protein n=1 Tax=Paenibacillus sp. PL2-23 TaxID=2100729 RepID=UPI0030FA8113
MFQHMFTSMNEMLDGITEQFPQASDQERQLYLQQIGELKKMSDMFIEQWLEFEEKVADFQDRFGDLGCPSAAAAKPSEASSLSAASSQQQAEPMAVDAAPPKIIHEKSSCSMADLTIPEEAAALINQGQGYYKLFMFSRAAELFQTVIAIAPECNLARLFLGMSQMHMQNWQEAKRHFQLLIQLSDFPKWLALGYNALGCIHAVHMNMAQAEKLFRKAYEVYPSFTDSLNNLKCCQETPGQLSLYFGSTELCCL